MCRTGSISLWTEKRHDFDIELEGLQKVTVRLCDTHMEIRVHQKTTFPLKYVLSVSSLINVAIFLKEAYHSTEMIAVNEIHRVSHIEKKCAAL